MTRPLKNVKVNTPSTHVRKCGNACKRTNMSNTEKMWRNILQGQMQMLERKKRSREMEKMMMDECYERGKAA